MKNVLEELRETWMDFVRHERTKSEIIESKAEIALRESQQYDAWAASSFHILDSAWRARHYAFEKRLEELYVSAEISERERALVEAGANTTCCCNNESSAFAWCSVTWPKASVT
jgi:hypothetical protein